MKPTSAWTWPLGVAGVMLTSLVGCGDGDGRGRASDEPLRERARAGSDDAGKPVASSDRDDPSAGFDRWTFQVGVDHAFVDVVAVLGDRAWLVARRSTTSTSHVQVYYDDRGDARPPAVDHEIAIPTASPLLVTGAVSHGRLLVTWSASHAAEDDEVGFEILDASGQVREPWRASVGTAGVSAAGPLIAARPSAPGWVVCAETVDGRGRRDARCAVIDHEGGAGTWHAVDLPDGVMTLALARAGDRLHIVAYENTTASRRTLAIALTPDGSAAAEAPLEVAKIAPLVALPVPEGVVLRSGVPREAALLWDGERAAPLEGVTTALASIVRADGAVLAGATGYAVWRDAGVVSSHPWPPPLLRELARELVSRVLPAGDGIALVGYVDNGVRTVQVLRLPEPSER